MSQEISRVKLSYCFGWSAWVGAQEAARGCCGVLPPDPGQTRALNSHYSRQFLLRASMENIFHPKHVLALPGFQKEIRMCYENRFHPS